MHPLDGSRLKVVRAQEHFDSLMTEIGSYLGTPPYTVVKLQNAAMPREPVDRTLEQIVKCVADIIPRFEPFL